MRDTDYVKPCPFCGGDIITIQANYSYKTRCYFVFCKCKTCGATAKTFSCHDDPQDYDFDCEPCDDAVRAWNNRANTDNNTR